MDEESPRNTSHPKVLGVTNMEKLGQDRPALIQQSSAPLDLLLDPCPILLKRLPVSLSDSCETIKNSTSIGQILIV
jgi:hypothetical protein